MRLQLFWIFYWKTLFLPILSLEGFKPLPRWFSAREARTSLWAGPQAETVETLWRLPNSPVSVKSTVSFLHSWGRETATTGAVRCTTTPKGVAFAFSPIPGSVLELTVATDKGSEYELGLDVRIVSRLLIPSFPRAGAAAATGSPAAKDELKAQQMQSLVRFAARSIVDSFNSEVADLISSPPPAPETSDSGIAVIDEDDVDLEKLKSVKQWPGGESSASINIDTADLQRRLGEAWVVPEPGDEPTPRSRVDEDDEDEDEDEDEQEIDERGKPENGNVSEVGAQQRASGTRPVEEDVEEGEGDEDGAWGSAATSIEGDLDALVPFLRSRVSADGNSGDSLRRQLKAMQNQKTPEPSSRQPERLVAKPETNKSRKGGFVDFAEPAQLGVGPGDMSVPGVNAAGLDLDKFKGRGVEEQALEELDRLVANSRKEGFAQALAALPAVNVTVDAKVRGGERYRKGDETVAESEGEQDRTVVLTPTQSLLRQGKSLSKASVQALLSRPPVEPEDLSIPVTKFPVNLAAGGLSGGIDIFEGPPLDPSWVPASSVLGQQLAAGVGSGTAALGAGTEVSSLGALEAALGTKVQNPATLRRDTNSLELLVTDLTRLPAEMHDDVLEAFRDLLLSDNFLFLLKAANATVSDGGSRRALGRIATRSSELTLELGLLVRTESVRHLETISDICEIAALYQEDEGEFLDRLDLIRPRFDTDLLGYLKFAITEEERFIAARGSDATRFPTQWLQILRVVQHGVRADVERRFDRLLDPILLTLRFTDPLVQERLFASFVNSTASLDLYYMRDLCCNLVAGMGESVRVGEFDKTIAKFKQPSSSAGGKQSSQQRVSPEGRRMLAHIKRFRGLVDKYLSEAVVDRRFKELELEAAEQGQEIVRRHRNILVQQQIDFALEREQQEMRLQSGESLLDRRGLSSGRSDEVRGG